MEATYYQDPTVTVTSKRIVVNQTAYTLSNVTSVSLHQTSSNRPFWILLGVLGAAMLAIGFLSDNSAACFGIGLVLLLVGAIAGYNARDGYAVRIGSASGETNALVSSERDRIQAIVDAINKAMVEG